MSYSTETIWLVIAALGIGTYAIRFSFLGLFGQRRLPDWALRHLRYTAVSILPALVVPLVAFPQATGGQTDPVRLAAAGLTLATGYLTKSVIAAILAGAGSMALLPLVTG